MKKLSECDLIQEKIPVQSEQKDWGYRLDEYRKVPADVCDAADAVIEAAVCLHRNCGDEYDPGVCPQCEKNYLCNALEAYDKERE